MRPTPEWQKGIGSFLVASTSHDKENSEVTVDVHVHSGAEESGASVRYVVGSPVLRGTLGSNPAGGTSLRNIQRSMSCKIYSTGCT